MSLLGLNQKILNILMRFTNSRVGGEPIKEFDNVKHKYKMLSLANCLPPPTNFMTLIKE